MTQPVFPSVSERRDAIRAHAASLGIDDTYICDLVEAFYARVRGHDELGPVFDKAIGDNWPQHLSRMKDFWASVTLNAGRYSGKPVPAHKQHASIRPEHFTIWLGLFEQTLVETAPSREAVDYFMERANRISQSLQMALFGLPGLEAETRA